MKEIITCSTEETLNQGFILGSELKKGDVVCLKGDLGTGKTVFTKGIAKAMGYEGYVTSPTFMLVNEYETYVPLYHFDVYRISCPSEIFEIGFEDYINSGGVIVIEWADIIKDVVPEGAIWVEISKTPDFDNDARIIRINKGG